MHIDLRTSQQILALQITKLIYYEQGLVESEQDLGFTIKLFTPGIRI